MSETFVNKLRVVRVEPGKKPFVKEMGNDLESIQTEVDGYFECVHVKDDVYLLCNEEGLIDHMPPNRRVGRNIICGPFILANYTGGEEYESLTPAQINWCLERFESIESFRGDEPELHKGWEIISW